MRFTTLAVGLGLGVGLWLVSLAAFGWMERSRIPLATTSRRKFTRKWPGLRWLSSVLQEAGFERIDPRVVVAGGVVGGLLSGTLVVVAIPIPALGFIAGVAFPLLGYAYLARIRTQRANRLRRAWPGVIDHLRAGVRSGHDVAGAVMALPDTLPSDISAPIAAFVRDIGVGLSTDDSLSELGRRLADPVADRIIEVLRMAHDVGGTDLPGVLLELQKSVRADIAVRDDAHAQQSWIRSASVLAVSAPWVVLLLIGTREATISAYQSPEGSGILLLGALVSLVAFGMMKKIGSLPSQRRWFG